MKYLLPFLTLSLTALLCSCTENKEIEQVGLIVSQIQEKYTPDKRVALFAIDTIIAGKPMVLKGETNLPQAKAEFIQLLKEAGIAFSDSLAALPSPALEGRHFGIVNVSVCNIRSKPKHSAELATQATLGTPLRVWKKEGGFYLVQTPDGYLGWLDSGGFVKMDSTTYQQWMASNRAVCLEDYFYAFEAPSENSGKVSDLVAGNILQAIGQTGAFTQVRFPDGRAGFVPSQKLMGYGEWLQSRQPDAEHVLAVAHEMMGRPYLWGGTSGKGMDCSGFTKTAYYLNGLLLPRDANQQAAVGEAVDLDTTLSNLLPGDLLFFGRKATDGQKERITHVGIYVGNGKLIHASDKVEIISLRRGDPDFSESRFDALVRSKRMIGSSAENGVVPLRDSPFYQVGQVALRD